MSTQNKSKLFLLIIAILAIANIVSLYFLLNGNCKPAKKKGGWAAHDAAARLFLQKNIGFSEQQLVQFDTLVKQHRKVMKPVLNDIKREKENQFKQIGIQAFSDSALYYAVKINADKQSNADMEVYTYLRNLRKLCTPSQQVVFDTSYFRMWERKK